MLTKRELPACPVATTVQLIGNKWKLLILRTLYFGGAQRFGEILKDVPGISHKVLTENLRALEKDGILVRIVYPEVPPHVEYNLSPLGETLRPLIKSMEQFGLFYQELVASTEPKGEAAPRAGKSIANA